LRKATLACVPEGDSLHRAARRLEVLVGERLEVEAPHPRAQVTGVAERLDGLRLESVEAIGKNLLLRFEGGVVLRSHLRMKGRWWVRPRGTKQLGRPWLVLRGSEHEAVQLNGPVLELESNVARRLGPDVLAEPPDLDAMLANLRAAPQRLPLGEALQRQRLVAGIGNMWMAEALWEARLSPWLELGDVRDAELRTALEAAHRLMSASVEGARQRRSVYRRAGRACPRCGARVQSRGQGDANRTAYWCPGCQRGDGAPAV
jgi:endonuclease VIII